MTALAVIGWGVATLAGLLAWWTHRRLAHRMEAVARACHEVRGPLTAIGLGLSLAGRGGGDRPGANAGGAGLRGMQTELARATLAVEDLTRLRGDVAARRPPAPVALTGLIEDAVAAGQGRAASAGVRLEGAWRGPDVVVWGDRVRLAQVLGNLIANAVEHGEGTVRVSGVAGRHGQALVQVADDGPGLPAPIGDLVRRPRSGHGRRGRGLAIASAIAREHGGRLRTAPAASGACVVLALPGVSEGAARNA